MAGFRKAKPMQAALKMGIFGPTGSGKTFTALLIAEGLAKREGKRIAYVDTEHGTDFYAKTIKERACHPEEFDFDAEYSRSITHINKKIRELDPAEYCVVVVDSVTHLWEAARNAYTGPTSGGRIPIHAWASIKKPYKDLETYLMNSPMHLILCGRQGVLFGKDDETGEMEAQGFRMKAEGETPYEPNHLFRMFSKTRGIHTTYYALAEKDRSGILAGRVIEMPTFEDIALPILKVLGGEQAQLQTADQAQVTDQEALSEAALAKVKQSAFHRKNFAALYNLAKTWDEWKATNEKITPEVKEQMTGWDLDDLRQIALAASEELTQKHGPQPKTPTNKAEWKASILRTADMLGLEGEEAICERAAILGMVDLLTVNSLDALKLDKLRELDHLLKEQTG